MAAGRTPVDQTVEPRGGYVTAIVGQDGRLPAPPEGDLYVRDPRAARAKAIRDRVQMYKDQQKEVPEHLQRLFDELPDETGVINEEVELVDQVTGEHVAEVILDEGEPQPSGTGSNTNVFKSRDTVEDVGTVSAAIEVPDVAVPEIKFTQPTGTTVDAQTAAIVRAAGEPVELPKPPIPTAPRPPRVKKAAPRKRATGGTLDK